MTRKKHYIVKSSIYEFVQVYRALRKNYDPTLLSENQNVERFLDNTFRASGRNISVAASFLPDAMRREARIAFLVCRTLDAYEDLCLTPAESLRNIRHAVHYFIGMETTPISPIFRTPKNASETVEIIIAQNLPLLKHELDNLAPESRRRIDLLVSSIADGMCYALTNRGANVQRDQTEYGEAVLGKAFEYVFALLKIESHWPIDCRSLGRVTQAANMLRDIDLDRLSNQGLVANDIDALNMQLYLDVAETGAQISRSLAALRFPLISRSRAAIAYMAATTVTFFLKNTAVCQPIGLASPVKIALFSLFMPRYFSRFICEIERLYFNSLTQSFLRVNAQAEFKPNVVRADAMAGYGQAQRNFEASLTVKHPNRSHAIALIQAVQLLHTAMFVNAKLSDKSLKNNAGGNSAEIILVADFLLSRAVTVLTPLGQNVLMLFGELISNLTVDTTRSGRIGDEDGKIAAFLSRVVGEANGLVGLDMDRNVEYCKFTARELYCL